MLTDISLKRLLDEVNLSLDDLLIQREPTKATRQLHRELINELCYRLNTLLGD